MNCGGALGRLYRALLQGTDITDREKKVIQGKSYMIDLLNFTMHVIMRGSFEVTQPNQLVIGV